jgi:hypothetical protein
MLCLHPGDHARVLRRRGRRPREEHAHPVRYLHGGLKSRGCDDGKSEGQGGVDGEGGGVVGGGGGESEEGGGGIQSLDVAVRAEALVRAVLVDVRGGCRENKE